jgi:hypothetical protein
MGLHEEYVLLPSILRSNYTWIHNYHVQEFMNKGAPFHMKLYVWVLDALSTEHNLKMVKIGSHPQRETPTE